MKLNRGNKNLETQNKNNPTKPTSFWYTNWVTETIITLRKRTRRLQNVNGEPSDINQSVNSVESKEAGETED